MNYEFDMCPDNNRNNGNGERLKQHKQDSETERVQQGTIVMVSKVTGVQIAPIKVLYLIMNGI